MRGSSLSLVLAILAHGAAAQEPGSAEITLPDHILFLATDLALPGPPLVLWQEDGGLQAQFAQLHLRFPLPPHLTVTLRQIEGGAWQIDTLSLDQLGMDADYHGRPGDLRITQSDLSDAWLRLRIEGRVTPDTLGMAQPVQIDLRVPLPPR
ncbi:hypothetical protein V8J82_00325 [Gymnodinialimonas sp. 2305UL16-5]|uniref:hypothetical protein n=1 Tax=Gymnodinialimonas mytili TaxID=3126503 RepID=UPI00309D7918